MSQSQKCGGSENSPTLEFFPEFGGLLNQLNLKSPAGKLIGVIASVSDQDDLLKNPTFKNIPLFPFPNRLDGGSYEFAGARFQMPINEAEHSNNLHGFGFDQNYFLEDTLVYEDLVKTTLKLVYDGGLDYFPFPSEVELRFTVREQVALEVEASITNRAAVAMPLGFGWHPYYTLNETTNDLLLQLPAVRRKIMNARALPTGEEEAYSRFSELTPIGDMFLDDCFELADPSSRASIRIWSNKQNLGLEVWQDALSEQFTYLQVFTHPDRKRIAVEPMTCNVNAFQTGEGLKVLQPGESFRANFGVRLISSLDE